MEDPKSEEQISLQNGAVEETSIQNNFEKGFFRKFYNIKCFVFIFGVAGCLMGASSAYFNGIVTTLEKRFKISSQNIGIIMSAVDIVNVLGSWLISFYGGRQHRPRLLALGLILLMLYNGLVVLPHFIYGPGNTDLSNSSMILNNMSCGNKDSNCTTESYEYMPQIIFFIAHLIYGFGDTTFWTLGTTFIDDNAPKRLAPLFMSITSFGRYLGPSLGLYLATVCLRYFVIPTIVPTIEHSDPRWIGAWWIGGIVLIITLIVPAIIISSFPRIILNRKNILNRKPVSMKSTIRKILNNKMIMTLTISSIFHAFAFGPFWTFTPKYIEIQFKQSPEKANMVVGSLGIVSLALGLIFSGVLLSYFKPRTITILRVNVFLGILSIFMVITYSYIGCEEAQTTLSDIGEYECNSKCDCNFVPYTPVCGEDGKTYISPCHAGCQNSIYSSGEWTYSNCTCIPGEGRIEPGACRVNCEQSFKTYIIVLCMFKFLIASGRGFIGLVYLRAVDERDKSAVMGFFVTVSAVFAYIPIPIFYGWIYDKFCMVWGKTCSSQGNCWLYDAEGLRFYLCAISLFGYCVGLVLDAMATKYSNQVKCFDDK